MKHSLFIAPVASQDWFNACAEQLGNGGAALVLNLSPDGRAPATQGWCAVQLDAEREAAVAALLAEHPEKQVVWRPYALAADPGYPARVLIELGLQTLAEPGV